MTTDREEFLDSPALAPPDGVVPNFKNPPNLVSNGRVIVQLVLVTLVVWMRLYTKLRVIRNRLMEDYAILIAWLLFVGGFHPIVFMSDRLPIGVHQYNMTIRKLLEHARHYHFATVAYSLVMIPLKVSLILQILRIFVPDRAHRTPLFWLVHTFLWINIVFYVTIIIYSIAAYQSMVKAWDGQSLGGDFPTYMLVHIVSASINTASDVLLFVLPQPAVWRLKLQGTKKWGLRAVFLFGIFGCVAAIVRLHYAIVLYHNPDMTYHAALMGIWAEPELTCGFLAACLPILPRFIAYLRGKNLVPRALDIFRSRSRRSTVISKSAPPAEVRSVEPNGMVVSDVEFEELVLAPTKTKDEVLRPSIGDESSLERKISVDITDLPKKCSDGV